MNTAQSNQITAFLACLQDRMDRLKDNSIAKVLLLIHQLKLNFLPLISIKSVVWLNLLIVNSQQL